MNNEQWTEKEVKDKVALSQLELGGLRDGTVSNDQIGFTSGDVLVKKGRGTWNMRNRLMEYTSANLSSFNG